ncbi:MAG: hypothetical protein QF477_15490 [SAR202 cluster bacterium]|nr:hypothetical protein [SAR202 cluster bacterium]MDP6798238.1 hypothetical protein [SAR202 cluster bacterium]
MEQQSSAESTRRDLPRGSDTRPPVFVQMTDALTDRTSAIRIEPEDVRLTVGALVDKHLRYCPVDTLVAQQRMSASSAQSLLALQDASYVLTDAGRLTHPIPNSSILQYDKPLGASDTPRVARIVADGVPIEVIALTFDRGPAGYARNWAGFHRRRWDRNRPFFEDFVNDTVSQTHRGSKHDEILALGSREASTELVRCLAKRIWRADFESYSRFTGNKLRYKTGDETVFSVAEGRGGICSEKVQALKFLTDGLGLESSYVLSGPGIPKPPPEDALRQILDTFDYSFSKRHMRYWQHVALLYDLDGVELLVDATNGNIPFLFVEGAEASEYLDYSQKKPLPVRMAEVSEQFYYHRADQSLVEDLYYAMENLVPEIDLVQVFDNELGLYIDESVFVTPVVYESEDEFESLKQQYATACEPEGLPLEISPSWSLDSPLGRDLRRRTPSVADAIEDSRDHLLERYDYFEGAGHQAGLVLIGLGKNPKPPV